VEACARYVATARLNNISLHYDGLSADGNFPYSHGSRRFKHSTLSVAMRQRLHVLFSGTQEHPRYLSVVSSSQTTSIRLHKSLLPLVRMVNATFVSKTLDVQEL
jgi:hypothetical protein